MPDELEVAGTTTQEEAVAVETAEAKSVEAETGTEEKGDNAGEEKQPEASAQEKKAPEDNAERSALGRKFKAAEEQIRALESKVSQLLSGRVSQDNEDADRRALAAEDAELAKMDDVPTWDLTVGQLAKIDQRRKEIHQSRAERMAQAETHRRYAADLDYALTYKRTVEALDPEFFGGDEGLREAVIAACLTENGGFDERSSEDPAGAAKINALKAQLHFSREKSKVVSALKPKVRGQAPQGTSVKGSSGSPDPLAATLTDAQRATKEVQAMLRVGLSEHAIAEVLAE